MLIRDSHVAGRLLAGVTFDPLLAQTFRRVFQGFLFPWTSISTSRGSFTSMCTSGHPVRSTGFRPGGWGRGKHSFRSSRGDSEIPQVVRPVLQDKWHRTGNRPPRLKTRPCLSSPWPWTLPSFCLLSYPLQTMHLPKGCCMQALR